MKAILFDRYFEAPDELNKFCKGIGYKNPDYSNDYNLMFDSRIVEFCEQRLSSLWNEKVYKGRQSSKFKIGFAGAGYVRDIDITRKWRLKYSNVDAPIIDYVDVVVNDYGMVSLVKPQKNKARWQYWEGWMINHDKRIDGATCSKCGYEHPTVKGTPKLLSDYCAGCGSKMDKE